MEEAQIKDQSAQIWDGDLSHVMRSLVVSLISDRREHVEKNVVKMTTLSRYF